MNEREYYEIEAFWKEDRYLKDQQELNRFEVIKSMIPNSVKSLLDIGCGNGSFLKYLEVHDAQIELTGLERSQAAIANKICQSKIVSGSANKSNYPDNSFDLVSALEVIEHLPYKVYEETLSEIQRISSRYIIISVPYREENRLMKCSYCGCFYSPFFHLRKFDKKQMTVLFNEYKLVKYELINRYKRYFLWDFLRDIWYTKVIKVYAAPPLNSSCPQCGYEVTAIHSRETFSNVQSNSGRIKSIMKQLTPFSYTYTWIACLYKKADQQ